MNIIGNGIYPLHQAARLVDAEPRAIRRWLQGYSRKYKGGETFVPTRCGKPNSKTKGFPMKSLVSATYLNSEWWRPSYVMASTSKSFEQLLTLQLVTSVRTFH